MLPFWWDIRTMFIALTKKTVARCLTIPLAFCQLCITTRTITDSPILSSTHARVSCTNPLRRDAKLQYRQLIIDELFKRSQKIFGAHLPSMGFQHLLSVSRSSTRALSTTTLLLHSTTTQLHQFIKPYKLIKPHPLFLAAVGAHEKLSAGERSIALPLLSSLAAKHASLS